MVPGPGFASVDQLGKGPGIKPVECFSPGSSGERRAFPLTPYPACNARIAFPASGVEFRNFNSFNQLRAYNTGGARS